MLKKDKQTFLDLVSGDLSRVVSALRDLDGLARGHFEDHPMSPKFIKEHMPLLVQLWEKNPAPGVREWAAQFIADAGIADSTVKPLIVAELANPQCKHIPTLLYLVGTSPDTFADIGSVLLGLASHPDIEVRWRVAYVISKMRIPDEDMNQAIKILKKEDDHTTQVYVQECRKREPNQAL
jgi:hypothetical protein